MDYLVVDLMRLLDESAPGRRAADDLAKRWEAARHELQRLDAQAEQGNEEAAQRAERLAAEVPAELERVRAAAREDLLARVRRLVAEAAAARGCSLVLSAAQTLVFDPKADLTDELLHQLT